MSVFNRGPSIGNTLRGTAALVGAVLLFGAGLDSASAQSFLDPVSPHAAVLSQVYRYTFFFGVAVFLLVEGTIIFAALRSRHRTGDPESDQRHYNARSEVVWTVAPAIIVLLLTAINFRP